MYFHLIFNCHPLTFLLHCMDQMFQVCELEESSDTKLSIFERFSVVSVPESWILLLEDETLVCFWPAVDTLKKIRSLHVPQDDEKGTYYKCRILLDGAKFSTYKKAKKAELIAQNVSSIVDDSVLLEGQQAENVCESTMDFDVSVGDMEGLDEDADCKGNGFNVTSVNDEKLDEIVGHDSFEYNKAMLKWRPVLSKQAMAMAFDIENNADEFSQRGIDDTSSDYSANFENGDNFLTSTVINESTQSKRGNVSDVLCKIAAVELKLSSFINEIRYDLHDSKEILRQLENEGGSSAQQIEKCNSNKDVTSVIIVPEAKHESAKENEAEYHDVSNIQREFPLKPSPTVTPMEEIHYDVTTDDIQNINETFVSKSVHVSKSLNDQQDEEVNYDRASDDNNDAISEHESDKWMIQRPNIQIWSKEYVPQTQTMPSVESQPQNLMKLQMKIPVLHTSAAPITERVPIELVSSVESHPQSAMKLPVTRTNYTNY